MIPRPPRPLGTIDVERYTLDVPDTREGDDHHLLGDQLFDVEGALDLFIGDLGPALVTELLLNLVDVVSNDRQDALFAVEDVVEVVDLGDELHELVLELFALEPGQATEAHVDDGLGLG